VKLLNPSPKRGNVFKAELWQAKSSHVSDQACCGIWHDLHTAVHGGNLNFSANADVHDDIALGVVVGGATSKKLTEFSSFLDLLRFRSFSGRG
jgi:hypothetical protein